MALLLDRDEDWEVRSRAEEQAKMRIYFLNHE